MLSTGSILARGTAIAASMIALLGISCDKSGASAAPAASTDPAPAGSAAPAPPALPEGAKACGNPAATPKQVVLELLTAHKNRDVQAMLPCFKPKHRERMAGRESILIELTVLSFSVGEEKIDGDTAQVAASIERYDGRGNVEYKHDPIRLERLDGVWYFR
jgi:hypothetical protein